MGFFEEVFRYHRGGAAADEGISTPTSSWLWASAVERGRPLPALALRMRSCITSEHAGLGMPRGFREQRASRCEPRLPLTSPPFLPVLIPLPPTFDPSVGHCRGSRGRCDLVLRRGHHLQPEGCRWADDTAVALVAGEQPVLADVPSAGSPQQVGRPRGATGRSGPFAPLTGRPASRRPGEPGYQPRRRNLGTCSRWSCKAGRRLARAGSATEGARQGKAVVRPWGIFVGGLLARRRSVERLVGRWESRAGA